MFISVDGIKIGVGLIKEYKKAYKLNCRFNCMGAVELKRDDIY